MLKVELEALKRGREPQHPHDVIYFRARRVEMCELAPRKLHSRQGQLE
jgi:hypothetical protein